MATLRYDETAALERMRVLIAASATFRSWSGANAAALAQATEAALPDDTPEQIAAAAAALVPALATARVFRVSIREAKEQRPWALVMIPESVSGEAEVGDSDSPTTKKLSVPVIFERDLTTGEEALCVAAKSDWPAYKALMDPLGAIRQEVEEASRAEVGGWFHVEAVDLDFVERASLDIMATMGDFIRAGFTFTLGVDH